VIGKKTEDVWFELQDSLSNFFLVSMIYDISDYLLLESYGEGDMHEGWYLMSH